MKPNINSSLSGPELVPASNTAAELSTLQQSVAPVAPTGAAMEAAKTGFVSPNILSPMFATGVQIASLLGAGVLMYAGMKTMITGKPPWKRETAS